PAFWEGGPAVHFMFNKQKYEELPPASRAALDTASKATNMNMLALYDVKNMQAIRRLAGKGVQLRALPRDVLDAAYDVSFKLYDELSASNANWKAMYEPWKQFRTESFQWFRVAEYNYDSYVYAQQAAGK